MNKLKAILQVIVLIAGLFFVIALLFAAHRLNQDAERMRKKRETERLLERHQKPIPQSPPKGKSP